MKQHYIPRCYLKRFSSNAKSIFTYDKINSKSYPASLMSVCFENDMYTMSDSFVEKNNAENDTKIDQLSLEHDHFASTVEPFLAKLLHEIDSIRDEWLTGKSQYLLTHVEKRELALHIVTLFFRHPLLQESTVDDCIRLEKASIDMMKEFLAVTHNDESFRNLNIGIKCEKSALHADLTYLNEDMLMEFAEAIASNIWIFEVSEKNEFYTSDFPVVVNPHVKNAAPTFLGLAQYGGELTFPLSSRLVLTVFDYQYFKEMAADDCKFVIASDKEIRKQNMLRYFYAKRHVFSFNNDFSLIDFIYKNNGGKHVYMSGNFKSEIVSGLGKY